MAEEKKKEEAVKEAPQFSVTGQGFFDGRQMHPPGTVLTWQAPEGWDLRNGKHHTQFDPHPDWVPMNKEAEDLVAAIQKKKDAAKK